MINQAQGLCSQITSWDSEIKRELQGLPEILRNANLQTLSLFFLLSVEKMKRTLSSSWCGGFCW